MGTCPFPLKFALADYRNHRKTLQTSEARIVSRFGWGMGKSIENHGLARFKANLTRVSNPRVENSNLANITQSREGLSLILGLLRQSRLQTMSLSSDGTMFAPTNTLSTMEQPVINVPDIDVNTEDRSSDPCLDSCKRSGPFTRLTSWFRR